MGISSNTIVKLQMSFELFAFSSAGMCQGKPSLGNDAYLITSSHHHIIMSQDPRLDLPQT
jgi:hypothetical protein